MAATKKLSKSVKLTAEQEKEGYWVEQSEGLVKVWHNKNQIALLISSPDIQQKVKDVVERRRKRAQRGRGEDRLETKVTRQAS